MLFILINEIVFDKPVYQSGELVHATISVTPLNDFSIDKSSFTVMSAINGESQRIVTSFVFSDYCSLKVPSLELSM